MFARIRSRFRHEQANANEMFMVCPHCHQWGEFGRCGFCGFDAGDPQAVTRLRATRASGRARQRAFWQQTYDLFDGMFHFHAADFVDFLRNAVKWIVLGGAVGVLAGTASWIFLVALAWATAVRLANPSLIFLLPLGGFGMGWLYHHFGGTAALGNNLVIDEVNNNRSKIPLRMAPLVLLGTIVTHLFGGSAGREGTAIQMGASLADGLRRVFNLGPEDRRLILMAGISGGFGSVFGVPAAGFVFGMEVQGIGRIRYDGIIPCLVAAFVGDLVTRAWGAPHPHYPLVPNTEINLLLMFKIAIAAVLFGLTSIVFVELTHGIKHLLGRTVRYSPLRAVIGGAVVVALTLLVGNQDYNGLSLQLITKSLDGTGVVPWAFALKLIFTAVTLGSGFLGGEVTPLFVIGSTLGYTLAHPLGVDSTLLAAVGEMALFAAAANTPLACAIMGIELFGGGPTLYLFLGTVVAYLASGHRGIYMTQPVRYPKTLGVDVQADESLGAMRARRREGWLPFVPGLAEDLEHKPVRAIMTAPAVSVAEDATLGEAVQKALREGVRAVPVLNARNQVTGILTDNDLRRSGVDTNLRRLQQMNGEDRAALIGRFANMPVRQVMSRPVTTVPYYATISAALELLRTANIKRLPVVDQEGHLEGLLTRSDILREIAFLAPQDQDSRESFFDWDTRVGEVELEPAVTVTPATPLPELLQHMQENIQARVVVVDARGEAVGMVSETDLLTRIEGGQRADIMDVLHGHADHTGLILTQTAADIMTHPVLTVTTESKAFDAVRLLIDNQIKRMPVIDHNGQVAGLVSRRALLHGMVREPEPPTTI